ncbi:flagellar biosynthesis protein FlgA [Paenibacillus sp. MWE-103]|uniref:Flagellar biosynthesis protein FlgA n=1 Tax=Paenibacillus artemisiicola TaxID=1172618 RepID=A0ABS3WHQ0_9BACL|nr:SAF domain-containing protein [Paenibacillus artemisiicola]MBO7747846.1 flagellar biosynthesis protein FlgA [Paenibacillus artemisiicola]
MNRKRHLLLSVTAALLSGLLVYGVYMLQLRQVKFQETVNVVVPLRFVAAGERLAPDMLGQKQIAKASFTDDMAMSRDELAGMEVVVPLGANEPLLRWKVDKFRLLPSQSQSTFGIPRDYVLSVSNGIRAGDKVMVYVSGEAAGSERLFPEAVTVASVKTAGNVEIDDADNSSLLSMASGDKEAMYASRRDANGMIDYINLNLTEAEWLKLDSLCKGGQSKLVIAYSPESLDVGSPPAEGTP